jgi:aminopeptidase N
MLALGILLVVWGDDPFSSPLARRHEARERTVDIQHRKITLRLDHEERSVSGQVETTFVPLKEGLEEMRLDCAELQVTRVVGEDGKPMEFRQGGDGLHITLDPPVGTEHPTTVTIQYRGSPSRGIYFVGPDEGYPDKPRQIFTQGECEDNHYWFPCHDYPNDRATTELRVTVKEPFRVISNGKLLEVTSDPSRGLRTYHWREDVPHVSYLVSLVVGEYDELTGKAGDVPLYFYVPHQDADRASLSFARTADMMAFFEDRIGLGYPYAKYAQSTVHDFMFGGMENISATTLTQWTLHTKRSRPFASSDGLVAHELSHQWWGDLLTCRTWPHIWLNEGFATYFTCLWFEEEAGVDDLRVRVRGLHEAVLAEDRDEYRRPLVEDVFVDPIDLFDAHAYDKGGAVLHMLRFQLGDEGFWKGIRLYARRHQVGLVETDDLRRAMEDATGKDLVQFFDQWVYKAGHPEFRVFWEWDGETKMVEIRVRQAQEEDGETPVFQVPVVMEVTTDEGSKSYRVWVRNRYQVYYFPAESRPKMIRFDEGGHILKEMEFIKDRQELIYQLRHDDDVIGRLLAIQSLVTFPPFDEGYEAFIRAARRDPVGSVRCEAIAALGSWGGKPAVNPLLDLVEDDDMGVRRAAVGALGRTRDDRALAVLQEIFKGDRNDHVEAEAAAALGSFPTEVTRRLLLDGMSRPSHDEVIRSGIIRALAGMDDPDLLPTVLAETEYGKPPPSRLAALEALRPWVVRDVRVQARLVDLLQDPQVRIRRSAAEILGDVGTREVLPGLWGMASKDINGRNRDRARRAIGKIEGRMAEAELLRE